MKDPRTRVALAIALLLAGCAVQPATDAPTATSSDPLGLGDAVAARYQTLSARATPVAITCVSTNSEVTGFAASGSSDLNPRWFAVSNLTDGNLHSAWSPAASDPAPSLTLDLAQAANLTGLGIKMDAGATFDVAVNSGGAWTTIATDVRPEYRALDFVALPASLASKVKLTFHVQPRARLLVCEVKVFGCGIQPSVAPTPQSSGVPSPGPTAVPSPGPTTSPAPSATPSTACLAPVDLSPLLANTAVLANTTITNTGPSVLNGDVDLFAGSAITGFPPGTVVAPYMIHATDGVAQQAQSDLTVAYNDAAGRPAIATLPANLGGQTLAAGVYSAASSVTMSSAGLTLTGGGNPNAVFIFQIGSALTVGSGAHILLINGAHANNVFWSVGSSATLGTFSVFQGSILANTSITLTTGATLNGRALAQTGAVTLDSNTINTTPLSQATCP